MVVWVWPRSQAIGSVVNWPVAAEPFRACSSITYSPAMFARLALTSWLGPWLAVITPEPSAAPAEQLHEPTLANPRLTTTLDDVPRHEPVAETLKVVAPLS